ncbi:hypothetical protein CTAYLR_000856, partial [Chrysophaeum taylorii]
MSETHGRLTGIRTHGRLGVQHQGGGILSAPLTNDLAELLLVALKSRVIRRDVLPLLSQEEAEALKFVERARELRVLSKTYHQERALRLAAMLYKTHFMGGNSRKFDGIGQHDRTAMTAALWERARKNTDQLRSYEVLEEVLEAASQRGSMLGLSLLPRLVTTLNFDDLLEEMGDSEQELPMVRALESIREIRHQGPEEWLLMFRSVVDKLKAAVVLSDMSIPGGPMICVNSTFCTITGYARQEAEGRNCRFLQGPATQLESLRVIQRTLASAADCQVAIYNYRKNGQIFLNLLSMRPVLDIDGKYTYVVAVQFEVNETCVLSQQRKLRMLDDLLALMPKAVPFKRLRIRDRPVPPVTSLRVSYDEEDERAVIWRCTFFATRLKWLTSPVAAITWLLSIVKLRHHLRELAASVDLGSAATLFAFEQAVAQKKGSPEWESHVDVLAKTFLPKVMLHPKSVELVAIIRQVEKDEKEEPAISNLLCAPSDTLDQGNPACSQEERLAKGFLHGITNAARDAPVSCIVVDVMTPGLPIVFANSRFLRLAGVSSENDVLGKNCRFLQGDVSQTTQRYLMEEIANSIRERQGVMVKMYNYARGKVFQNLIVLHPVFSTAGGEYLYQIGAQVNMSENGESVEANLANLERFVALLPETVDITSETDRATLLLSTTTIKDVHTCRVGDRPADDALEAKSSSITELPTIEEQQRQKQQQQQQQTKQAPEGNQGGGGSGGVGWHDMPQASCDPKLRLEIESECLQAIVKMTSAKWLDVPEQTTAALFRQKGLCHDAFTAFAAKRSRVAKALVRCWDIIEEILTEPVLADQKQLALKYHAVWQENPLFLFAKTEIPVGALSKLDFNWDPILQQLPHTQARCERVLSVHVLPDFLSSTDGQEMIRKLLGHPDSSLAYLKDPHAYMDENPADGEAFKLPPVPEVHPDLYTAAQHPSTGVPVLAVKAGCADKSSFWLEMISNLIGDDDSSSLREKERLQSLDGAVVDTRDEQRQHHEDAINKGEHLGADDEGRSQVDARSVGGVSTNLHLKSLVQERTALRRDGLMEKALELDAPIAQLQAEYRKERDERLTRVLENAKRRLQHQHQIRFRDLEAKHKQERMALDKQIDEGLERIREEHQVQTSNYIAEVMSKTGAKSDGEDDENKDTKPYLAKNQRHHIRTTTKPPEMVHQLKMAKHLRRKRRYAEAHDAERKARDIDLENTKTLCESVKKMATGTRLQNLVLQQETAVKLFQRRQASRLNNMYRRQEAAVTNLENLH